MTNRLLVAISVILAAHSCVYGMKREITTATCEDLITLPDEIIKKIFTDACYDQPNTFFVPKEYSLLARLARMRSVCKRWYNQLQPADIKRIANINTNDIEAYLIDIIVNRYSRRYSHVQFLAQMIKNQLDAGDRIFDRIMHYESVFPGDGKYLCPSQLNIFIENGLVSQRIQGIINPFKWDRCIFRGFMICGILATCTSIFISYYNTP
jgi:hypothetical protein